jgi:hypothetical protein
MNMATRLDERSALMESFQNARPALGKMRYTVSPRGSSARSGGSNWWWQRIGSTMILLCMFSTRSIVPVWQVNGFQPTHTTQQQHKYPAGGRERADVASFWKPTWTKSDMLRRTGFYDLKLSMNRLPYFGESFSSRSSTANRVGWGATAAKARNVDFEGQSIARRPSATPNEAPCFHRSETLDPISR